jgi:two-component system response regulator DevR
LVLSATEGLAVVAVPDGSAAASEHPGRRMLIVEDARIFRAVVKDHLCWQFPQLEVIEAESVAEGYRQVQARRPRLVLLDVRLPDGNGLALARQIRDEMPDVVVCICTCHDYPEYRQASADCGAAYFMSKDDMSCNDLEALVRSVFPGIPSTR